ncbi:MAG: EAL domain-containing protein [Gammaproteobacteria bacterium]|nr:EAL domain-containing protein [Gammaproteobacteria bacterium]
MIFRDITHSFRNRIFLVIVGLVALVQSITVVAALDALRDDALEKARHELEVGQRVFERLLAERSTQLATAVRILASDYGFKEAIATSDTATIESVLANHGGRVKADLAAFIARDATIVTSTHAFTAGVGHDQFPFQAMLADAASGKAATGAIVIPGAGAFQIVVTPVRAPELIGWICIGFVIDDALAANFRELTNLDVSFAPPGGGPLIASTLRPEVRAAIAAALKGPTPRDATPVEVETGEGAWLTLHSTLPGAGQPVVAVLQASMQDALRGLRDLVSKVLVIVAIALALAVASARLVANSVTSPLRQLADAARRIAGGFYGEKIAMARGDEFGVVSSAFNDMQEGIAQREARILHQAQHDGLTGLPNRLALRDRIEVALARAGRSRGCGAVLLVDIVDFKAVNDALGHQTGDAVLKEVSRRLAGQARAADTVARYGGNGFVLLLEGAGEAAVRQAAQRILDSTADPLRLDDGQVRVDLTVGISLFPAHGEDAETLLRRAEIALYAARAAGRSIDVYTAGQDESYLRRISLLGELAVALDSDQMEIYYQPKMDLRTRRVRQAEALVRWMHPTRGMVPPDEFIGLAEQSGLIGQLTQLVLLKAVRQIRSWSSIGLDVAVSVNVSALDLAEEGFADRLLELLRQHAVSPRQLTLEMTESTVIRDMNHTREVMRHLRDAGVHFSIDDFGTGYSSLAQLRSLPLHELKIDKSFVLNLTGSQEDALIVRSTIDLAHNMGLVVCAEGVESEAAIDMLLGMKCDIGQGFCISRPMAAGAFADWLARREAPAAVHDRPAGTVIGEGTIVASRA